MALKEETYAIIYPQGAYGFFISWLIQWLSDDNIPYASRPWDDKFLNSHGHTVARYNSINKILESPTNKVCVSHIKDDPNQDTQELLCKLLEKYSKVIFLQTTPQSIIWVMNRKFFNATHDSSITLFERYKDYFNNSYARWDNNLKEIWEQREWLSYCYYSWVVKDIDMFKMLNYIHPSVLVVPVLDIRDNFYAMANNLLDFLGLPLIRNKTEMATVYDEWLVRQPDAYKDTQVSNAISGIINKKNQPMTNMTIVDQAEIQRILREEHKIEIKCFNLNTWPENTNELLPLLYRDE